MLAGAGGARAGARLSAVAFRRADLAWLEQNAELVERGVALRLDTTLQDGADRIAHAPARSRDALLRILDRLRRAHEEKTRG